MPPLRTTTSAFVIVEAQGGTTSGRWLVVGSWPWCRKHRHHGNARRVSRHAARRNVLPQVRAGWSGTGRPISASAITFRSPEESMAETLAIPASLRRRGLGRAGQSAAPDFCDDFDLRRTTGFLVADARGRVVGRVEGPMFGSSGETPDALSVRSSVLRWRRRLVPASAIAAVDDRTKVIGLGIDRDAIRTFL